jgi:hypothetical protein
VRAGVYVLGTINTNRCPAGLAVITTEAQCRVAAAALSLAFDGSTSYALQPKGCSRLASSGRVEFSTASAGAADPNFTPICAGKRSWRAVR